jgi:hypothetical protein
MQSERLEVAEDDAGVLARDVAEDHVAVRPASRAVEPDDVDHRRGAGQDVHDLLRELGRRDDPQVDHAAGRLPRWP